MCKSANESKKELSEGFIVLKPLGDRVIIEVAKKKKQLLEELF